MVAPTTTAFHCATESDRTPPRRTVTIVSPDALTYVLCTRPQQSTCELLETPLHRTTSPGTFGLHDTAMPGKRPLTPAIAVKMSGAGGVVAGAEIVTFDMRPIVPPARSRDYRLSTEPLQCAGAAAGDDDRARVDVAHR